MTLRVQFAFDAGAAGETNFFTLDDLTKGVIGSTTYTLGGVLTAYFGLSVGEALLAILFANLIVLIPLLAHASWHAYRDLTAHRMGR